MAEVKIEQPETQGIKLFGKTIVLDVKLEVEEDQTTNNNNSKNDEDDDDDKDENESSMEKKRPEKIVACPRCKSMDTKFCYFNNYNVNQPRHFCKGCQRYWTAGGALRNVPVGAGRRKSKPGPTHLPSAADINSLFVPNHQCLVFQEYWAHHQRQSQHLQATGTDGFHQAKRRRRRRMINDSAGQTNC